MGILNIPPCNPFTHLEAGPPPSVSSILRSHCTVGPTR